MTKTAYKVGDKVRILAAKEILFGFDLTNGKEYEVAKMSNGGIYVIDDGGDRLYIHKRELQYTEKVEESDAKMTQFKVGDKVRITSTDAALSGFSIGNIVEITRSKHDGSKTGGKYTFEVDRWGYCNVEHIELVSPKPTKNQRISTLEKEVETLKAEVEALKAAQKSTDIAKIAEGITKMVAKEMKLTPNERRKAIIDEAKAFIAENTVFEEFKGTMHHGVVLKSGAYVKPVYWVLPEKRIVEVNMVGVLSDKSHAKGIAKCAPGDVFNEHIGKAIALGRALGLDVSKFEKAVQPSEVVVGMVVIHSNDADVYAIEGVHKGNRYDMRHTDGEYFGKFPMMDSIENFYDILDDTEAKY